MRISFLRLANQYALAAMFVFALGFTSSVAITSPAFAQVIDSSPSNDGDMGGSNGGSVAGTPQLAPGTNGTVGPQGADATVIRGVNTAGTVRVNNLANMEALLNIIANGMEILGIAWGGPTMIHGFMHMAAGTRDAMKKVLWGAAGVTGGLATPGAINWLVASARDANLFS